MDKSRRTSLGIDDRRRALSGSEVRMVVSHRELRMVRYNSFGVHTTKYKVGCMEHRVHGIFCRTVNVRIEPVID
jgi:hypothetical protein